VRLIQQTQGGGAGVAQVLRRLAREDGVRALWAGNGANCVRVVPFAATVCGVRASAGNPRACKFRVFLVKLRVFLVNLAYFL